MLHGPRLDDRFGSAPVRLASVKSVVLCPTCKTQVRVLPNQTQAICPNPACQQRIVLRNPEYQRGDSR